MAGFVRHYCCFSPIISSVRHFSRSPINNGTKTRVGFIGLGNMGAHMSRNLLNRGHPLVVYDVFPEAATALQELGAQIAHHPAEVAEKCDRVVTMLPNSSHVKEVFTGENGILETVTTGTLLIDSSTIDPSVSREIAVLAQTKGAVFMDAPVSGGVNGAKNATLTFMVGGPEKEFQSTKALLTDMGKNIVYCGPVGSGQAAKICNNMLLGISMIGTAEAMNLGIRLGLDPKLLSSIINTSSGRCWSSEVYNPVPGILENVPSSNNYQGGFGSALIAKDLGLAQNAAIGTSTPIPLGSAAYQLYRLMSTRGYGLKDFSSVFEFLQEINDGKTSK